METTTKASILLDLSDAEELERLQLSFSGVGLEVSSLVGPGDLAEAVRERGADFVLLDGRVWAERCATLPQPPRSYLIVVLLDPEEESGAPAALSSGAFDYLLRDGPGWEARAGLYFCALAALRRRLSGAFGALERRYEDLVHALPDIVYELDTEGRFTFINNSVRLLGWEPSDLAGKHFSVLLHEDDARAVDRVHVLGHFKDVATGPALSPKLFNERRGLDRKTENLELRLRRRSGEGSGPSEDFIASVISYGEVTAVGEYLPGEGDGLVGSVGVIRDITLRRKSEDMLRKLYQAVDQLSAGVVVTDRNFHIEYVNPAFLRISGKGPQDILGKGLFTFFHIPEARAAEILSLVNGGFEARQELEMRHGESSVWLAVHASPVRSPSGDVTHASVICEDITGRRAMEELLSLAKDEAEEANRAKSDFLAAMGHELKSPVAAILAAARLIEMGRPGPEKLAATIIEGAQGLLSILSDILDYVHFESGTNTIHKFVFPLRGFIARTIEPFKVAAAAKGLAFELGPLPDEALYSDPDRLSRALSAIVDNAVRYTTSGKVRIEASMERRDGNIPHFLLSVADTGKGIAPEDQGRIFSPFVQLESEGPGAGIGLSLARNIVRALGGEVRLESTLGRGSVFTILLPSGEPNEVKPSASPASGPRVYRLLVVDDNEVNLEYMAALLRNAGHRVDTAQNGAEALSLAEEHCPDAAILDIQMPGINGIELERRIRSATGGRYDPGLPLIALTAFDPKEIASSGARFCAVFSKPFDARNLAEALDKGIAASEAAAFSLGTSSRGHLLVAAEDLPDYMASLERALVGREAEAFRSDAQQLALRLETLGAEGAAAAFRRLALALAWEDEVVIRSRLERYQAAWEASLGQGLSTP